MGSGKTVKRKMSLSPEVQTVFRIESDPDQPTPEFRWTGSCFSCTHAARAIPIPTDEVADHIGPRVEFIS